MSLNKVFLIANLTRDVELKYIQSGSSVANFGVAVNEKYKDKEETIFIEVSAWSKIGELCAEYLQKGSRVFIEGKLKFDEWEKDGQKRTKLSVLALNVQFLDKK